MKLNWGACIESKGLSWGLAAGFATAARQLPWGMPGWGEERAGRWNPDETARFKPSGQCAVNTDLRWEREAGDL